MYTKQEMSRMRELFWTTFGRYMSPVPSAAGEKINWINYKTGVKHIRFLLEADDKTAVIALVIHHPDEDGRKQLYDKLLQMQAVFVNTAGSDWTWEQNGKDEYGKSISRVYVRSTGHNITRQDDWPGIISFFKTRIIALDAFWQMAKDGFEV